MDASDDLFGRQNSTLNNFFSRGFFVLWHINLRGLFNAKAILIEEHSTVG